MAASAGVFNTESAWTPPPRSSGRGGARALQRKAPTGPPRGGGGGGFGGGVGGVFGDPWGEGSGMGGFGSGLLPKDTPDRGGGFGISGFTTGNPITQPKNPLGSGDLSTQFENLMGSELGALNSLAGSEYSNKLGLLSKNNPTLDFFSGDPSKTPLYKADLTNTREATASAYDNAVVGARQNAESRGFGYTSPVEQGAETGLRTSEAGALARAPSKALQDTIGPELAAAQIRSGEASQFNPNSLLPNPNTLAEPAVQPFLAGKNAQSQLYASLLGMLGNIGSSAIGNIDWGSIFHGGGGGGDNADINIGPPTLPWPGGGGSSDPIDSWSWG